LWPEVLPLNKEAGAREKDVQIIRNTRIALPGSDAGGPGARRHFAPTRTSCPVSSNASSQG
jgi:hypothetical protein